LARIGKQKGKRKNSKRVQNPLKKIKKIIKIQNIKTLKLNFKKARNFLQKKKLGKNSARDLR
jgi:hypothetical protein